MEFLRSFSDVISRGNRWWRRVMSSVFLRLVLVGGRFFMVEGTDTFPRFINEYRCGDLIARTERKKEQMNIFDYI